MGVAAEAPQIERIVAPNPGPMTLEGTNTYVVAHQGASWIIDPGPADRGHLAAVHHAAESRGEVAGVLLTHSHSDHSEGVADLGLPLVWGAIGSSDETDPASGAGAGNEEGWPPEPPGDSIGPFTVVPTPGHSIDHVCLLLGRICFCGDLVLGSGSSFVPPDGGSLAAYLDSLGRLRGLDLEVLHPGHGPLIDDPTAKIDEYLAHRLEREQKLLAALDDGVRGRDGLLDRAWDDVPAELRPAAELVMQAHLEKLEAEGRLPALEPPG